MALYIINISGFAMLLCMCSTWTHMSGFCRRRFVLATCHLFTLSCIWLAFAVTIHIQIEGVACGRCAHPNRRCAIVMAFLQDKGPLFRHFKPQFPFSTDGSLTKASKLNCTFVFQKVAAPLTTLPRLLPSQPGNKPLKHASATYPEDWLSLADSSLVSSHACLKIEQLGSALQLSAAASPISSHSFQ